MPQVQSQPTLVEQVVNAIVSEIVDGELPSNARLIQDDLARAYGVKLAQEWTAPPDNSQLAAEDAQSWLHDLRDATRERSGDARQAR